jgi:endonuclease YncB( thermonuclease family)
MLGWRKRNDGFEWRDYVRTTILVRRKERRDRVGEAAQVAVENLKEVGQRGVAAGAEGAKVVGRGAVNLGQQGAKIGAVGAKAVGEGVIHYGKEGARLGAAGAKLGAHGAKVGAAGAMAGAKASAERLRAAVPVAGSYMQRFGAAIIYAVAYTWAVLRTLVGIAADYLGPLLAPVGRFLRQPGIRLAVLIAGGVALLGGIIRASANGFERDTWIALVIGLGLLSALALAHASLGLPASVSSRLSVHLNRWRDFLAGFAGTPVGQKTVAGLAVVALIAFASHALLPAVTSQAPASRHARGEARPSAASSSSALEGRATAVAGDTLRIGGTSVKLDGIEAPLPDQICSDASGGQWNCGDAARHALARIVRPGRVSCDVSASSEIQTGSCTVNGTDVAADLVRGGHVFAVSGLFAPYTAEEREARAAKSGLWAGDAAHPSDYRDQKWAEAKRASPDGCPIKGSVRGGRRLYVVPWARGYEQVRVTRSRGERWFCSESEAIEAGFKPAEQS